MHVLGTIARGPGAIEWSKTATKKRKHCKRVERRRAVPWLSSVEATESAPIARCQTTCTRPRTGSATPSDVLWRVLSPRAPPLTKIHD